MSAPSTLDVHPLLVLGCVATLCGVAWLCWAVDNWLARRRVIKRRLQPWR